MHTLWYNPQAKFPRFKSSWVHSAPIFKDANILDILKQFPRDHLDDEQMELMEPYLAQPDFTIKVADVFLHCKHSACLCRTICD